MTNDEDYSDPADYGIIGVLDCSTINCILLFPQACLLVKHIFLVKMSRRLRGRVSPDTPG